MSSINEFFKKNKDNILGGAGMASNALSLYGERSKIKNTKDIEYNIEDLNNTNIASSSTVDLINQFNNRRYLNTVTKEDLLNDDIGIGTGLIDGITGAINGSSLGNAGTVLGGVSSFVGSLFGQSSAEKKAAKEAARLSDNISEANAALDRKFSYAADNISKQQGFAALSNYAALGGSLRTHGADFTNGLIFINEGGTHESNPYEGVQIGVDNEGIPNLVEEGEVVFNNYVFSNRLKPSKEFKNKYKLGGGLTFADAVEKLSKESMERPNDPISMNGLNYFMSDLANNQEEIRMQKENKTNSYACGGKVNKYKEGTEDLLVPGMLPYFEGAGNSFEDAVRKYGYLGTKDKVDLKSMLSPNSQYMKNRQYFIDNWDKEEFQPIKNIYLQNLQNRAIDRGKNYNWSKLPLEEFKRITTQDLYGYAYDIPTLLDGVDTGTPDISNLGIFNEGPNVSSINDVIKTLRTAKPTIKPTSDYKVQPASEDRIPSLQDVLNNYNTGLRDAPIWGSISSLIQNSLSKPNYTNANRIAEAANKAGEFIPIVAPKIGNYMSYEPLDKNYYANRLMAQAATNAKNIMNMSGGNRAATIANLIAADRNAQEGLGNLFRQAEEFNQNTKFKVNENNRAVNQFNAQTDMQAQMANQQARHNAAVSRMQGISQAANMMETIDNIRNQGIANSYSNLIENFGNKGQDEYNRGTIEWLGLTGAFKGIKKNGDKIYRKKGKGDLTY